MTEEQKWEIVKLVSDLAHNVGDIRGQDGNYLYETVSKLAKVVDEILISD